MLRFLRGLLASNDARPLSTGSPVEPPREPPHASALTPTWPERAVLPVAPTPDTGSGASRPAMRDIGRELVERLVSRGVRLERTAATFPHVVERLAAAWDRPTDAARLIDTLVLDDRGDRQGFPPDVVRELVALQSHLRSVSGPGRVDPWTPG